VEHYKPVSRCLSPFYWLAYIYIKPELKARTGAVWWQESQDTANVCYFFVAKLYFYSLSYGKTTTGAGWVGLTFD